MIARGRGEEELKPGLVLDACQVINLYATRRMPEILRACGWRYTLSRFAATTEVRWVGSGRVTDPGSDVERVDLSALVDEKLILIEEIEGDEEAEIFLKLAMEMDEGEAIAGAIAVARGMLVGTDDHRAIQVFTNRDPQLKIVTTPQLVHTWSELADVRGASLRTVLDDIRTRARFVPRSSDPLATWWIENLE